MPLETPVAFVVFNRPAHAARTFARIRDQRPERLFVIADGPRADVPTDAQRCGEVRAVVGRIDWECEVTELLADANMGLRRRITSGLDAVFAEVERAVIIEDDCVPTDDFFAFTSDLLNRYADDGRVVAITGDNFQDGQQRGDAAYYFSRYSHVWGWATWRRAWEQYDRDISFWPEWRASDAWRVFHPDPVERRYWTTILDNVHAGRIATWDYQWMASAWRHGGLTATPNANLVSNIGFGPDATHTSAPTDQEGRATEPLGPLMHPSAVRGDLEADRFTFERHYGGDRLRSAGTAAKVRSALSSGRARLASGRRGHPSDR